MLAVNTKVTVGARKWFEKSLIGDLEGLFQFQVIDISFFSPKSITVLIASLPSIVVEKAPLYACFLPESHTEWLQEKFIMGRLYR